MVKEIRAWRAKDGTLFDEFGKAAWHDLHMELMGILKPEVTVISPTELDVIVNTVIDHVTKIHPAMSEYLKAVPQAGPHLDFYTSSNSNPSTGA